MTTEPPTGPAGPPTQEPAVNLAAFQSTDDKSDLVTPGHMVVHPATVEPNPRDENLPVERREYTDPNTDLNVEIEMSGEVEVSEDKASASGKAVIKVNDSVLALLTFLLVCFVVTTVAFVIALFTDHPAAIVTLGVLDALFAVGLVGTAVHNWFRKG